MGIPRLTNIFIKIAQIWKKKQKKRCFFTATVRGYAKWEIVGADYKKYALSEFWIKGGRLIEEVRYWYYSSLVIVVKLCF